MVEKPLHVLGSLQWPLFVLQWTMTKVEQGGGREGAQSRPKSSGGRREGTRGFTYKGHGDILDINVKCFPKYSNREIWLCIVAFCPLWFLKFISTVNRPRTIPEIMVSSLIGGALQQPPAPVVFFLACEGQSLRLLTRPPAGWIITRTAWIGLPLTGCLLRCTKHTFLRVSLRRWGMKEVHKEGCRWQHCPRTRLDKPHAGQKSLHALLLKTVYWGLYNFENWSAEEQNTGERSVLWKMSLYWERRRSRVPKRKFPVATQFSLPAHGFQHDNRGVPSEELPSFFFFTCSEAFKRNFPIDCNLSAFVPVVSGFPFSLPHSRRDVYIRTQFSLGDRVI